MTNQIRMVAIPLGRRPGEGFPDIFEELFGSQDVVELGRRFADMVKGDPDLQRAVCDMADAMADESDDTTVEEVRDEVLDKVLETILQELNALIYEMERSREASQRDGNESRGYSFEIAVAALRRAKTIVQDGIADVRLQETIL